MSFVYDNYWLRRLVGELVFISNNLQKIWSTYTGCKWHDAMTRNTFSMNRYKYCFRCICLNCETAKSFNNCGVIEFDFDFSILLKRFSTIKKYSITLNKHKLHDHLMKNMLSMFDRSLIKKYWSFSYFGVILKKLPAEISNINSCDDNSKRGWPENKNIIKYKDICMLDFSL